MQFSSRSTTSAKFILGLALCTLAGVQVGALPFPRSNGTVALPQRCKTSNIDWYISKFANQPARVVVHKTHDVVSPFTDFKRRAGESGADGNGGDVDSSEPNTSTSVSASTVAASTPVTAASPSFPPPQAQSDSKSLKPKTRKHRIHTVASLNVYLHKVKERRKARKAARAAAAAKAKEATTPPVPSVSEERNGGSEGISERDLVYAYEPFDELD